MSTILDKNETQLFVDAKQGVSRHGRNECLSRQKQKSRGSFNPEAHRASAIRRVIKLAELAADNYQPPRQLVTNGHWSVPPDQRPANWKTMNIPEAPQ